MRVLGSHIGANHVETVTVAHQHHLGDPEATFDLVHLGLHHHRVGQIAFEDIYPHRATVGVGDDSELDLGLPPLALPPVAIASKRALAAFQRELPAAYR